MRWVSLDSVKRIAFAMLSEVFGTIKHCDEASKEVGTHVAGGG